MIPRLALICTGLGLLGACDEAMIAGLDGGPALGAGGAPGDAVFTRDEQGCLYQRIEGNLLPIVDENGRKRCGDM